MPKNMYYNVDWGNSQIYKMAGVVKNKNGCSLGVEPHMFSALDHSVQWVFSYPGTLGSKGVNL